MKLFTHYPLSLITAQLNLQLVINCSANARMSFTGYTVHVKAWVFEISVPSGQVLAIVILLRWPLRLTCV